MSNIFELVKEKNIGISTEVIELLKNSKSLVLLNTHEEMVHASTGGKNNDYFEVKYETPGKGLYTEAIVHKVKNGISANYTEAYMRRRDPNTMVIADNGPTDKKRFSDKYGYDFQDLKKQTYEWLQSQDLVVFFYFAGREEIGSWGWQLPRQMQAFSLLVFQCFKS